jgi:hypothetical protein
MKLAGAKKAKTAALCREFLNGASAEDGREKTNDGAYQAQEVRKAAGRGTRREECCRTKKSGEKPPAKGPVSGGTSSRSAAEGGSRGKKASRLTSSHQLRKCRKQKGGCRKIMNGERNVNLESASRGGVHRSVSDTERLPD